MSTTFTCATCGQEHSGLPFDYSFGLPDEVFALDFLSRYLRSRSNSDLCTLDDSRFFIRGVIPLPFRDSENEFCWGAWVEVSRDDHDKYVRGYNDDLSAEPEFQSKLANDIPGYGGTIGLELNARYGQVGKRPSFHFPKFATNALAKDQHDSITSERHHALLDACGHFKKQPAA